MSRWFQTCQATLLLALGTVGASAAEPQRVLMVFKEGSHVPANVLMERGVRVELRAHGAEEHEIHTGDLDANRSRGYLREKYRDRPPDVSS
jgi:hypothetical protein